MEGADPIVQVRDLPRWWARGLRLIGLTYGDTAYGTGVAGGSTTFKHGGLTPEGVALLKDMAALGFTWDISHLAEEGVWQGLDLGFPRVGVARQRPGPDTHRSPLERRPDPRCRRPRWGHRVGAVQRLSGAALAARSCPPR